MFYLLNRTNIDALIKHKFPNDYSELKQIGIDSLEAAISVLNQMLNKYHEKTNIASDKSIPQSDMDILMTPKPKKSKITLHPDLAKFLNSNSQLTGIEFWKSHQKEFPSLYAIFCQLKSIQASSASVERLFSLANLIFDDLSAKMDEETILHNLVLKYEDKK